MNNLKIVNYDIYCQTCKYKDLDGIEEPCNECLDNPVNEDSKKPVKYEEEKK